MSKVDELAELLGRACDHLTRHPEVELEYDYLSKTLDAAIKETVLGKPFIGELTSRVCQVGQCPHRQREALEPGQPESLS